MTSSNANAATATSQTPKIVTLPVGTIQQAQKMLIAATAPAVTGDTLSIHQTAGSGTVSLQSISGTEFIVYTAPAKITGGINDKISYAITDTKNGLSTSSSMSINAYPGTGSVTAPTATDEWNIPYAGLATAAKWSVTGNWLFGAPVNNGYVQLTNYGVTNSIDDIPNLSLSTLDLESYNLKYNGQTVPNVAVSVRGNLTVGVISTSTTGYLAAEYGGHVVIGQDYSMVMALGAGPSGTMEIEGNVISPGLVAYDGGVVKVDGVTQPYGGITLTDAGALILEKPASVITNWTFRIDPSASSYLAGSIEIPGSKIVSAQTVVDQEVAFEDSHGVLSKDIYITTDKGNYELKDVFFQQYTSATAYTDAGFYATSAFDSATGLVKLSFYLSPPSSATTSKAMASSSISATPAMKVASTNDTISMSNSAADKGKSASNLSSTSVSTLKSSSKIIHGTSGDDVLAARSAGETILGGGGNDVISSRFNNTTIVSGRAGDGLGTLNEVVSLGGQNNDVTGGDENFHLTAAGSANTIDIGDGNETIIAPGYENQISVGRGTNTIIAGTKASVTVNGSTVNPLGYNDTIQFSGWGNSFKALGGYAGLNPGTVNISGGDGGGTFDLQGASGTLVTDGLYNTVNLGSGNAEITPGSGDDTVNLAAVGLTGPSAGGNAGSATVHLNGSGNSVTGSMDVVGINGGSGQNIVYLGTAPYEGTDINIDLGGAGNDITLSGYLTGAVDAGSGHDTVDLATGGVTLTLHGTGNMVFIAENHIGFSSGNIVDDQSQGSTFTVSALNVGLLTFSEFNAASGSVIDLQASGFKNAAQAFAAVRSDGAGGSILTLGIGASIHFTQSDHLSAANFKIG